MLHMFRFPRRASYPALSGGFVSTQASRTTPAELWQARWLVLQLVRRDLAVRYRQTWLGGLWAILNPAMNLALWYGVFGLMVRFNPPDYAAPYALVLMSGLVPWMLFSSVMNAAGDSLLNNVHLLKKVYFPRTALPVAATGVSLVDFVVALGLLLMLLPMCGVPLSPARLPWLFICAGLMLLGAWGLGCLVAVAKLRFRDLRHLIPLIMQAWFYFTPVVWTPGLLSPRLRVVMDINPLTGLVGWFRWVLVGGALPPTIMLAWSVVGSLLLAVVGYRTFVRYEAEVSDRE